MEIKFTKSDIGQRNGRSFLLLPFFLFLISCATDLSRYGRITLHNTADNDSFVFSVSDEFLKINSTSTQDKKNPKMTEAESKLLTALLQQKKYCLDSYGSPFFTVTSRQEKIFDMTFAHLIEENYNARPIAPRMYFGRCGVR